MTSKKNLATTKIFSAMCLGLSFFMAAAPAVLADTFSIDGTALNTNNQFPKLDGNPLVFSWPLNPNDPDQQFEIQSGKNSNSKILKHRSTSNNSVSYCLNAHYLSNGGKVNLWPCNPSDSDQNFIVNNAANNTYSIQRVDTGFCVNLPGRGKNIQVNLAPCNGNSNQLFTRNAGAISGNSANTSYLPFDPGVTASITQGYNGTTSHGGSSLSAYPNRSFDHSQIKFPGILQYAITNQNNFNGSDYLSLGYTADNSIDVRRWRWNLKSHKYHQQRHYSRP